MSQKYFSSVKELMRHLVDGGCIRDDSWPEDSFMHLKDGDLLDSFGGRIYLLNLGQYGSYFPYEPKEEAKRYYRRKWVQYPSGSVNTQCFYQPSKELFDLFFREEVKNWSEEWEEIEI